MYGRLAGALLIPLALILDAAYARTALEQAWPPFVLVAGLLLIGLVAGRDGLFDAAAARLVRISGPPVVLLLACFALIAVVSALLNLDTSVVFLTPVLVKTARRRGVEELPFLYGSIFMANASSLFLPGSNLTNLLVLSNRHVSGGTFFTQMLPMALAATLITAAVLVLIHRRSLRAHGDPVRESATPVPLGLGFWGALAAAVLIVLLRNAALPVLGIGVSLLVVRAAQRRMSPRETISWLGIPVLVSLFGLSVALGTLARASAFPADLMHSAGAPMTALVAALATVLVNNLPAAVLLSSGSHLHTSALLLGLNVGPNLAVTGSLAVLLWWRAARAIDAKPSVLAYSRQGLLLAPLALAGALLLGGS
ncbi:MAG TPA: SLC13 family permease [Solirubrobacteraceae bacterium]|jgi:arsenical pump membrane protein|nr:SLC13 family permease [Solirubrobacteraceae bacterium]